MTLHAEIMDIYGRLAQSRYGLEDVSQREHALQTAQCAANAGEGPSMILAGLLHDVGHMIHKLGENPAADGVDDKHEAIGAKWLRKRLPPSISEPVALHVAAKRYLCAIDADYMARLAPDSIQSLKLQGGPLPQVEHASFLAQPFAADAVRLRRYDDMAKTPGAQTSTLEQVLGALAPATHAWSLKDTLARDGVVVLRGWFSPEDCVRLARTSDAFGGRASRILREAAALPGGLAAHAAAHPDDLIVVAEADDPEKVCRFEYVLGADPAFADFVAKRVTPVLSDVAGEAFAPFKDKENEKHPGGGAFGPHQDFAAYQAFGPRINVTAMLTIDPATIANGCLEFAHDWAGVAAYPAHQAKVVDGRTLLWFAEGGPQNGDIRDDIAAKLIWRPVETMPGDLVIFDSFAPHRSARNMTATPRRAMFLTYAPAKDGDWYGRYYADKRANYAAPRFHVSTPTARG